MERLIRLLADVSPRTYDLHRLKQQSTARFHRKWDDILAKYSQIDDNAELDEIDLSTGQIITDNGHLRSMLGAEYEEHNALSDIWSPGYDDESEQSEPKESTCRKLHVSSSPLSRTRQGLDSPRSDNLLILGWSRESLPVKPLLPLKRRSPLKDGAWSLKLSRTSSSSPLKRMTTEVSPPSLPTPTTRKGVYTYHSSSEIGEVKLHDPSEDIDNFDDSGYSLDSHYDPGSLDLYSCAFPECSFCSELKSQYRDHLLRSHVPLLQRIGYPIGELRRLPQPDSEAVLELTILKLALHFPLLVELPDVPFVCGRRLNIKNQTRTCRRVFFLVDGCRHHRLHGRCSARKQVLRCPVLGCDFICDEDYTMLTSHMNVHLQMTSSRSKRDIGETLQDSQNDSQNHRESTLNETVDFHCESTETSTQKKGRGVKPQRRKDSKSTISQKEHALPSSALPSSPEALLLKPDAVKLSIPSFDIKDLHSDDIPNFESLEKTHESIDELFQD